jgi:hypothetical protein
LGGYRPDWYERHRELHTQHQAARARRRGLCGVLTAIWFLFFALPPIVRSFKTAPELPAEYTKAAADSDALNGAKPRWPATSGILPSGTIGTLSFVAAGGRPGVAIACRDSASLREASEAIDSWNGSRLRAVVASGSCCRVPTDEPVSVISDSGWGILFVRGMGGSALGKGDWWVMRYTFKREYKRE